MTATFSRASVSLTISALWWLMLFLVGSSITTDGGKQGIAVALALVAVASAIPAAGSLRAGERRAWCAVSSSAGVIVGSVIAVVAVLL